MNAGKIPNTKRMYNKEKLLTHQLALSSQCQSEDSIDKDIIDSRENIKW